MVSIRKSLFIFLLLFSLIENFHAQDQIKPENPIELSHELTDPQNWVAQGGCWTFSDTAILAQAGRNGRHSLYFNKESYMNFELQVRLKKLAEGGTFGVLIRYDENKTAGYAFTIFPHGEYMFAMIKGEKDSALFKEPVDLNRDIKGWDTAKIICIGQKFHFYLNDEFLTSVTDKKYNRGRIGFFLGGDPRQKAMFQIISLKQL